jgi:hypothetical protein
VNWLQTIATPVREWIEQLPIELSATLGRSDVWLAMGLSIVLGSVALLLGVFVARRVGLLSRTDAIGETIGVGLAVGLVLITELWSVIASRGQSAFTPTAVVLAVASAIAIAERRRTAVRSDDAPPDPTERDDPPRWRTRRAIGLGGAAIVFVLGAGILYGTTTAPSPRDGAQPVEFRDAAFYASLATVVTDTGLESTTYPSGFDRVPGSTVQAWYHWGEVWLAAIPVAIVGLDPMLARSFVALPLLLLAAALLTGSIVRRMSGVRSTGAFVFGAGSCLLLAPLPISFETFYGSLSRGLVGSIGDYGFAAVLVLLVLDGLSRQRSPRPPSFAPFMAAIGASLLPAHLVVATLAAIGALSVGAARTIERKLRHRSVLVPRSAGWMIILTVGISALTVGWGVATGHGIPASAVSALVTSFGGNWLQSVAGTFIGGVGFFAIPIAWFTLRSEDSVRSWAMFSAMPIVVAGAVLWGARLSDHNNFHLLYAAIAVFAMPMAAVAGCLLWKRMRDLGRPSAAALVACMFAVQLTLDGMTTLGRLGLVRQSDQPPIPERILTAIRALPADAKLAYACQPFEEIAYSDPHLVTIYTHTRHRVIPMCFEADSLVLLLGVPVDPDVASPLFAVAPQRVLYPTSAARPTSEAIAAFLKDNGVSYIFANETHPNTLAPTATEIASAGSTQVLQLP